MRRNLPARYPIAVSIAVLALTLVGCAPAAPADKDGFDEKGCATSGSASESVKVSGDFGTEPKVEFKKDLTVDHTQRTVDIKGKGDAAKPGDDVTVDLVLYDVATSKQLLSTGYSGAPQTFGLDPASVLTGIVDVLNCAKAGERVVGVVPPERAFGATGQTDLGVAADATLIFVMDVVKIAAPPTPAEWTDDVPTVTRDASGTPTVTFPDTAPPTELLLSVLTPGDGDVVKSGDNVTVNYQGTSWDTKKIFDQSYGGDPATFSTGGVIPGFEAALVGQKVGSSIIVSIPPELAYGTDPNAHELGGQTLVFVIDILKTAAP